MSRLAPHTPVTVRDRRSRPLRDLRISVTDRCNFRCGYCMPRSQFGPGFRFLPANEILSFEETARLARCFVSLGVRKLRITGGEPLLRRQLPELIAMLPQQGIDLAMTTNGSLLAQHAPALKSAGLSRVTVSLDALDDAQFRAMADAEVPVARVLEGIQAAVEAGLQVKVNAVVRRGVNESAVLQLAGHFRGTGIAVRFIEFMDVGNSNRWQRKEVVSAEEMLQSLSSAYPLEPLDADYVGEVARRYRYRDGQGEVGFIASVTRPFCGDCTRGRLSATGRFYNCLFASHSADLRQLLRSAQTDEQLQEHITGIWAARSDAYSEQRGQPLLTLRRSPKVEMSHIGG